MLRDVRWAEVSAILQASALSRLARSPASRHHGAAADIPPQALLCHAVEQGPEGQDTRSAGWDCWLLRQNAYLLGIQEYLLVRSKEAQQGVDYPVC